MPKYIGCHKCNDNGKTSEVCRCGELPVDKIVSNHKGIILKLTENICTWEFLADGLTQDHQQSVKNEILTKVNAMKKHLKDLKGC